MTHSDPPKSRYRRRRRGSELIEFSLVIMPMFAMIFVELDITWGIFCKATLEEAVRVGARYGITNTIPDLNRPELCAASPNLTDCVTQHVQWAAGAAASNLQGGLLGGSSGASYVTVDYYPPGSNTPIAHSDLTANNGGNIMVVSVKLYPIHTLLGPYIAPQSAAITTVASADTLTTVPTAVQPAP